MTFRSLSLVCLLALLVGCSSSTDEAAPPSPPDEVAAPTAPDRSNRDPQAPDTYQVRLDTTEGEVVIDVDRKLAPRGADRFYRLVKESFYDEAKFFRVLPGFMAQVGMAADPKVNAKWQDARIPDDPVRASNTRGMVTFATSGPDSRTAQFFINFGDNSRLDGDGFSPFGEVTKGLENAEKLYSGYGEGFPNGRGPNQGTIAAEGNAYLERDFPELDAIKTARVISENGEPVGEAAEKKAPSEEAAEE
ncbi:MAG: peptidylprolyl isomerase [Planctomycetota bacterium]|nr:peptidylprolyl isomerase [Planctomycetota bacterium]